MKGGITCFLHVVHMYMDCFLSIIYLLPVSEIQMTEKYTDLKKFHASSTYTDMSHKTQTLNNSERCQLQV